MPYDLDFDASDLQVSFGVDDLSPFFHAFHAYMVSQIDRQFETAGGGGSALQGGSARGVYWAPYSQRYLGRKRPSGARVTAGSRLLQDTGRLRQMAATEIVRTGPKSLAFGTRLRYAGWQNARRPWAFIADEDANKAVEMLGQVLDRGLEKG